MRFVFTLILIIVTPITVSAQIFFPDGTSISTGPLTNVIFVQVIGTPTDNGTALLSAMGDISVSNTTPIVVQLDAGVYDLGSTTLELKPNTLLRGLGRITTVITGTHSVIINVANETAMRDLQVLVSKDSVAVKVDGDKSLEAFRIAIVLEIESAYVGKGLELSNGAEVDFNTSDVYLELSGGAVATGIEVNTNSSLTLQRCNIISDPASNSGSTLTGIKLNGSGSATLAGTTVNLIVKNAAGPLTGIDATTGTLDISGGDIKVEREATASGSLSDVTGILIDSNEDVFIRNAYVQSRLIGSDGTDQSIALSAGALIDFKAFATWFVGSVPDDRTGGPYAQCYGDNGELNGEDLP